MRNTFFSSGLFILLFVIPNFVFGQIQKDQFKIDSVRTERKLNKLEAIELAKQKGWIIRKETNESLIELMGVTENGLPIYYTTHNENAAITISTNKVYSGGDAGLSLDGDGVMVGEWDGGSVRSSHQEFGSRVTIMDGASTAWHATHVAGTIMASGINSSVKGMAYEAELKSYDWNDDVLEMNQEAADGLLVSNHSYGYVRGWNDGAWNGDADVSSDEDYLFGFYDDNTKDWDDVAYSNPNYLIVKSAGNDRNDSGDGTYPSDGPWDCISQTGVAKNILTVGAVNDISGGYTQPSDVILTSFSSCGPVDDGRIKPDIVANGYQLISTYSSADDSYYTSSGTSMSTPSVAGSVALLIQHWENEFGIGEQMRSATAKAIIINTADEAGTNDGPDYEYGWGLMNTENAALKISEDLTTDVITEHLLSEGETYTRHITTNGISPIRVTLVWTDPSGTPVENSLDPVDAMLVNDLDIVITDGSNTFYPWKLDRDNPEAPATNSMENNVDNVESIDISTPSNETTYTITVDHDGTLSGDGQAFTLVITGDIEDEEAPEADFYADEVSPAVNTIVNFHNAASNNPTSWTWSFNPSTVIFRDGTNENSQNPDVEFDAEGVYEVSLECSNAFGNDSKTKVAYINVGASPSNYTDCYSKHPFAYISRIQLEDIDNSSTYTNIGDDDPNDKYYEDWTSESTDVTAGQTYSITMTTPSVDEGIDFSVWVDVNRDGDFNDSDEQLLCDIDGGGTGTREITIPSDADIGSTRMRVITKYLDDYCVATGSLTNGEVEDYILNIQAPSTTWSGNTSTDWNTVSNWSGSTVPSSGYNVEIPNVTNIPVIGDGQEASVHNLTIQSDAALTVNGSLAYDGLLTIESDATSTGSLIVDGTIESNGNTSLARYVNNNNSWHFLSAPVAAQQIQSGFVPAEDPLPQDFDFYYFDETATNGLPWINIRGSESVLNENFETTFTLGRGYLVAYDAVYDTDLAFSGQLNVADFDTVLTYSETGAQGWNMIGNPFTAAIDWSAVDKSGLSNLNYYVYDNTANGGAGDYVYHNGTNGTTTGYISPNQGFFVKVDAANSFSLPVSALAHSDQNFLKSNNLPDDILTLEIANEIYSDEVFISIHAASQFEEDRLDAMKLFSFNSDCPAIYAFTSDHAAVAFNNIPQLSDTTVIDLGTRFPVAANYTISLAASGEVFSHSGIYLEDTYSAKIIDLSVQPEYTFDAIPSDVNRFRLHLNNQTIGVDENELSDVGVNIWTNSNQIIIDKSIQKELTYQVFNMLGQSITSGQMNAMDAQIIIPVIEKGVYLVSIQNLKICKVIIQ